MAEIGQVKRSPSTVCELEWSIPAFASLTAEGSDYYRSPSFEAFGKSCYLTIYSNHFTLAYVYIRFNMSTYWKPSIVYKVSFAIKNADGNKVQERHDPCQTIWPGNIDYDEYSFISRAELLERASELMPSNILTVICSVRSTESMDGKSESETSTCTHCNEILEAKAISFHEKNCCRKPVKCPECSMDVSLGLLSDHGCQSTKNAGETGSARCTHCQEYVDAESISLHEKKCLIKCPECSEVVALKNWNDHECQTTKPEGETKTSKCTHCQEIVDAQSISGHEKKCLNMPIKCPQCSEVVALKNWHDHECQKTTTESLTEVYKKVLLDGRNHDLILKVGDIELRAHRDILRARSHVFQLMLDHDMKEKESGVIDVHDCDPQAMELFLSYIYTDTVEALDKNNMLRLYYVADKYDMQDLKDNCCEFIKKSLLITNICDVIQLALSHSNTGLLEYATEYFMENTVEIMVTVEWQSFLLNNTSVGNELLLKSFRKMENLISK